MINSSDKRIYGGSLKFLSLLPFVGILLVFPCFGSDWELIKEQEGIKIYRRPLKNTSLLSFRGIGEIDAPFGKVVQILLDSEKTSEWANQFPDNRILKWIKKHYEEVRYSELKMPLFFNNRDFISLSTATVNYKEKYLRVNFDKASGYDKPLKKGNILGDISGSYFIIYSLDGGKKTKVDGVAVVDIKGRIPIWIVNFFQARWPYNTLINIRKQSKKSSIKEHSYFSKIFQKGKAL